jgi:diacylglycerol kinase (ATP)
MKIKKQFSIKSRFRSFCFATNGIRNAFNTEPNLRIHAVATIGVIVAAICFTVSATEVAVLALAVGLVWMAELFNTAIERIADFISPEKQSAIGLIKDIAAAAVLITALTALAVGCFIFIPKC